MPDYQHPEHLYPQLASQLVRAKPHPPSDQVIEKTMKRVREFSQASTLMAEAQPQRAEHSTFTDGVMARISRSADKNGDVKHEHSVDVPGLTRWPRVVTHVGSAVAAALLVSFFFWQFGVTSDEGSSSTASDPSMAGAVKDVESRAKGTELAPEELAFRAQIRHAQEFEGKTTYVIDAGVIQGLREGAHLQWRYASQGGALSVIAVSPYFSLCIPTDNSTPQVRASVSLASPNERVRKAKAHLAKGHPEPGAYWMLGTRFAEHKGAITVEEVLDTYWQTGSNSAVATLASLLGLKRGDELVSLMGEEVRSLDQIGAILGRYRPERIVLVAVVRRNGEEVRLSMSNR